MGVTNDVYADIFMFFAQSIMGMRCLLLSPVACSDSEIIQKIYVKFGIQDLVLKVVQ